MSLYTEMVRTTQRRTGNFPRHDSEQRYPGELADQVLAEVEGLKLGSMVMWL